MTAERVADRIYDNSSLFDRQSKAEAVDMVIVQEATKQRAEEVFEDMLQLLLQLLLLAWRRPVGLVRRRSAVGETNSRLRPFAARVTQPPCSRRMLSASSTMALKDYS